MSDNSPAALIDADFQQVGIPPPPAASPPGGGSPMAQQSPLSRAAGKYYSDVQGLSGDEQKEFAQQQQETAPYRQKILDVLNSPNEAQAHLQEIAQAPKPEDYRKYSMQFFAAMSVLGAIGSRFTRRSGTAALNAFGASIKGWQQGNLQAYEDAYKQWQGNMEATLHNNQIEIEKYQEIMNDKKANIDQMMAAMNIVAGEHQNKIMFDATMAKNYTMAFQAVDKMQSAQQKAELATAQLDKLHGGDANTVKDKVDFYNKNPQALAELTDKDYLSLKGASDYYGFKLADRQLATGTADAPPPPGLSQQEWDSMADFYRLTGKEPNLGWGAEMNRYKLQLTAHAFARQQAGIAADPGAQKMAAQQAGYVGQVAGARTLGTRSTNIDLAGNLAASVIPRAIELSNAFPRGQFTPINAAKLKSAELGSNVELNEWDATNLQLAEAWARAMNPNAYTIRKDLFDRAVNAVSQAKSAAAYQAIAQTIQENINREKSAVSLTMHEQTGDVEPQNPTGSHGGSNDGWGNLQVR